MSSRRSLAASAAAVAVAGGVAAAGSHGGISLGGVPVFALCVALAVPLGRLAAAGIALWGAGFIVEVAADAQKRRFRLQPENADRFIATGLWARCRHPNYLGEILLWTGVAVTALPALDGWRYLTLVSPVFVWLLLTRVSGIPLLEAQADRKWGADPAYRAYKARTPALVPRIGRPRVGAGG